MRGTTYTSGTVPVKLSGPSTTLSIDKLKRLRTIQLYLAKIRSCSAKRKNATAYSMSGKNCLLQARGKVNHFWNLKMRNKKLSNPHMPRGVRGFHTLDSRIPYAHNSLV